MRMRRNSPRNAAVPKPTTRAVCALGAGLLAMASGCATLRDRSPVPDYVAKSRSLWHRGVSAMESGRWYEAESWLRQAAEVSPQDADTNRHLAQALRQRGSLAEALAHAELACRFDPGDPRSLILAGEIHLATNNATAARERATEAITIDGKNASAWALRGRAFRMQGDADRALADTQQALRYAPNDTALLTELAALQHERGAPNRGLVAIHHLLDSYAPGEEPAGVLALEGRCYADLGRPQEAADSLRLAIAHGATDADTHCYLAHAEAACGRPDQALAEARLALGADSNHAASQELVARLTGDATTLR
ncbi:cellulose synthase subunit BcsC [Pseudobythopirellula maris]|uniref:Cellulose synthase subunit BcsC n=1 Tax=Pseudobythopirellula maris TaxID=2527991 RepID=A0A5C5ZIB9_9BACT|nr:tetratricopeptide repeat protein [Pseudobythopirellula maris]TWT86551.1 cellulose synthase subunit BcsC [Pseudobythopirellula maris]